MKHWAAYEVLARNLRPIASHAGPVGRPLIPR